MRTIRTRIWGAGVILLATLFSAASIARAQTPSVTPSPTPSATPTLEHEFFKNIVRDQKTIWTSPFHLSGADAKWLVPFGLGTAALMTTDRRTGDAMAKFQRQLNASRIISFAGSTYSASGVAAGFYLIGRATHNDRARETGLLAGEALGDSVIVVSALKEITQRVRPPGGRERSEFFEGGSSFPSGHSIQAWSVATVVAHEYHDHVAVEIAAYGLASAVSVARFTGHNHYLSDVLVGSAMGYGIGRYVYRARHRKRSGASSDEDEEEDEASPISKRWPSIAPQYNRHAREYGVALAWSF